MKKINIQHESDIKAEGKYNSGHCKPVICIETGEVFTSVADAAEKVGCVANNMSSHLTGRIRSIKGKHFCYLSRVNESLDAIITRLRETSAVEADAKKWQAYKAEQDAIRAAEEKRAEEERKAKEELLEQISKAEAKVARRTEIRDRKIEEARFASERLMEAERELETLQDLLNNGSNNNQEAVA